MNVVDVIWIMNRISDKDDDRHHIRIPLDPSNPDYGKLEEIFDKIDEYDKHFITPQDCEKNIYVPILRPQYISNTKKHKMDNESDSTKHVNKKSRQE